MASAAAFPSLIPTPESAKERGEGGPKVYLDTAFELAKLKLADDLRTAERERRVRRAGASSRPASIDATPFRERISRLVGRWFPLTAETAR
jgi:hypothetical protein